MDNITQGVIGGSLYTLITGRQSNKNFWLGAGIANIPDLDVFVGRLLPLGPIDQMFFHRGIMHSIVFNIGVSLVLGYVLYRSDKTASYWRYMIATFISILFGHLLVDGMTSYGMRYWLPFSEKTYSSDNIFVVDFGMWAITISGFVGYMISQAKQKIAQYIVIAVGSYFALTFIIQWYAMQVFTSHYPQRGIPIHVLDTHTLAEPLQPLLWRHLIKTPRGYYEGYYSLFDRDSKIDWKRYKSDTTGQQLVDSLIQDPGELGKDIRHIASFSRGNYRVVSEGSGYRIENMIFDSFDWGGSGSHRMFSMKLDRIGSDYSLVGDRSGNSRTIDSHIWKTFWNRVVGIK